MSYNSKYKGEEVEGLLESIGNKVDKVDGKQLSTEDFTTLLKQKLDGLSNYDDTEIQEAVSKLRTDLDTLVSGDTTTAIKTFNEVIAFLDGLEDTEDLSSIIASIEQQIAAKGTVTSVTAGDGLTGGTITGSGTIALESLGTAKELGIHPQSTIYTIGLPSGVNYSRTNTTFSNHAKNINIDKHGRVSSITTQTMIIANIVFGFATDTKGGFMSAGDKAKLDGVDMTKKQDKLVSGTNIKTINGTSILGSGNIVISGGSSSGGSGAYAEVNHGASDTTFTLTPNTFHVWDEVASLDLSFAEETAGVANEYLFQFTSGATATTLTLPDVKWANEITIAPNTVYQMSVLRGLGSVLEFNMPPALIENKATLSFGSSSYTVSFQYPVESDIVIKLRTQDGPVTKTIGQGVSSINISPAGPMVDTSSYIEALNPGADSVYQYTF